MRTNLATDALPSLLAKLAIPSLVALFASSLYSITDSIFLGKAVGELALAGLGYASPIQLFLVAFAQMFGAGSASVISRALGKQDEKRAGAAFSTALTALVLTVCSLALLFFLLPSLLLKGDNPAIQGQALAYLKILLPFTPLFCASTFLSAILRSEGKADKALLLLLLGNGLNIALDALFILKFGWGIKGAALATALGHTGACAYALSLILNKKLLLKPNKPDFQLLKQIVPLGLPSLVRQLGTTLVIATVNTLLIQTAGQAALASYTIINQLTMLAYLPLSALVMGFSPIAGFAYGASNKKRLRALIKLSLLLQIGIGLLLLAVFQLFSESLVGLFSSDKALVASTLPWVRIVLATIPFIGIQSLGAAYFQSIGKSIQSLLLWTGRQFLFLLPLVLAFSHLFGSKGLWFSFPLSDMLAVGLTIGLLIQEKKREFSLSDAR
ncbi:MATE family efflux transporter [Sphaerochaeta globosa]|uniref:Multidrug export protein MepA n=1 Tax=Sphaerochaeta globosa (strain ATCC BAA-1886 / DSM 22777 / Buddy) TaxID=158189 RepID=F0RSP2_SPHGB|nr:MATE family efflux transporter [Sphaerochaeta globosa]ADY14501.1 MATE efflux family protein [Sphaerochaeta globosa str. Buddy]